MSGIVLVCAEEHSQGEYLPRLALLGQIDMDSWGCWNSAQKSTRSASLSMDQALRQVRSSKWDKPLQSVWHCVKNTGWESRDLVSPRPPEVNPPGPQVDTVVFPSVPGLGFYNSALSLTSQVLKILVGIHLSP